MYAFFRAHLIVVAAVAACALAGAAQADLSFQSNVARAHADPLTLEAVGKPQLGGSWFQDFAVTTLDSFTRLGIALTNPDASSYFGLVNEHDFAMSFANGGTTGWAQNYFGPFPGGLGFIATSVGGPTTSLLWRSHFADPTSHPFTMTVFAYDDITTSTLFNSATATWNGSRWTYNAAPGMSWHDFQGTVTSVVPLPSAAALGLVGLSLVGVLTRRFAS